LSLDKTKMGNNQSIFQGCLKGAKQVNEDCTFAYVFGRFVIMAVFDGHGENGKLVANTAKNYSIYYFNRYRNELNQSTNEQWKSMFPILFDEIQKEILQKYLENPKNKIDENGVVRNIMGDPITGGSTGTIVAILDNKTVISANIGDSSAFIVRPDESIIQITTDHAPDNQNEFKRIQKMQLDHPLLFVYDTEKSLSGNKYLNPKVFKEDGTFVLTEQQRKNPWGLRLGIKPADARYTPAVYAVTIPASRDSVNIGITRSFGNFYIAPYGMTHRPEISITEIDTDAYIIIASDGVWDSQNYQEFSKMVNEEMNKTPDIMANMEQIFTNCVKTSISVFSFKQKDGTFSEAHDDISMVMCLVKPNLSGGVSESASASP
jgi:serine/threonine protein phosphatase PrpC